MMEVKTYDNSNDESYLHQEMVASNFKNSTVGEKALFKTNVENLFDVYIAHLPFEARQYYTCNCCRNFINKYGGLVSIDEKGNKKSVLWDVDSTPKFFKVSVSALKVLVEDAKVNGVFITDEKNLGSRKTGAWTHLHAVVPNELVYKSSLKSPHQEEAEKHQDFLMLNRALQEFTLEDVELALALINSDTMYRSDKVLGVAEWLKSLHVQLRHAKNSEQKRNIVWKAVATAPTGYAHIRSSMIGTLLEDISSGMSPELIASRFAEKMNPSNYMRSQSAPTANQIVEAEKTVQKLGIQNSLQRRYAKLEEINEFLWKPKAYKEKVAESAGEFGSVFGHLMQDVKSKNNDFNLPTKTMTWDKFLRTVLPTASEVEAFVDNSNRFMALVTALDEDAPNILQWDNPFSWYYNGGGIDGEIKKRVTQAGGRYENNLIRCSLMWEGLTDLDLHCINPLGKHIYYGAKRDSFGGFLDLDMNGIDKHSETPVENLRWAERAPEGVYKIYVRNFSERRNHYSGTPFVIELEIEGDVYTYHGEPLKENRDDVVFEFDYKIGKEPVFKTNKGASSSSSNWNIQQNSFVKVNGIIESPNLWGDNKKYSSGSHVFFLLDGVKDESEGKGKGFLNEMLKGDLRAMRKTLELFTDNAPVHGVDEATACGVGFTSDGEWNLTLKVKTGKSTQLIKIDRWD